MKSSIKSYIICTIIVLAFYFLLISKRIKQNKEKDILENTKEKSFDEIEKILPYYKTNKGFLRKLNNNENKVTIQIRGNAEEQVNILSNGADSDATDQYSFFSNNHPDQIKLNNESILYEDKGQNYLEINLTQNGLNTIEIIWNYTLSNLENIFEHCIEIESIDFTNFDFSKVTNAKYLMGNCRNLKYVNCGNGNFRKVEDMKGLFYECSSLVKVDNFFITLNVTTIDDMFYNCNSLQSIDLSNLYMPFLIGLVRGFFNCTSLETIELPNFNHSQDISENYLSGVFAFCNNLKYINLLNHVPMEKDNEKIFF